MQLGFVSAILPDLSLEQLLSFAAAERFECVELMCWPAGKAERRYAGVTHVDVDDFGAPAAARVRDAVAAAGVAVSALGYYPNPLVADEAESLRSVAHLEKVIRAAALLGVRTVNTFAGRNPAKTIDDNWPRFLQVWRPLVKLAEEQGVRIAIENCPMLFTKDEWPGGKNLAASPAVWRRMFADIPSAAFGLNYDPSHLLWQRMDYLKPLREFAGAAGQAGGHASGRILHVHAKDVRVDAHRLDDVGVLGFPKDYHQPKLPGLGEVDWGRFFSVLGDSGYDGPVCIEVEDRDYEKTLGTRQQALRQSRDYLRNFVR
jgi:sugar phosphate isomerase/epimerase